MGAYVSLSLLISAEVYVTEQHYIMFEYMHVCLVVYSKSGNIVRACSVIPIYMNWKKLRRSLICLGFTPIPSYSIHMD